MVYQASVGIYPADGVLSPLTRANINSHITTTTTTTTTVPTSDRSNSNIYSVFFGLPSSYRINNNLSLGSRGAEVVTLQSFLEIKGFLTMPAGVAKGEYDQNTKNAVIQYQISKGISPADGTFGPITRAVFAADLAVYLPAPVSVSTTPYIPPTTPTTPVVPTEKPDLVISDVVCESSMFELGKSFKIPCSVTILNNSNVETFGSFKLDTANFSTSVRALKGMEKIVVAVPVAHFISLLNDETAANTHFFIDSYKNIPESNESNNEFVKTIPIAPRIQYPDMTIQSVTCTPESPLKNQSVTCAVVLYNNGMGSTDVPFMVSGFGTTIEVTDVIASKANKTLTFTGTALANTNREYIFVADSTNVLKDNYKENNVYRKTLRAPAYTQINHPVSDGRTYTTSVNTSVTFSGSFGGNAMESVWSYGDGSTQKIDYSSATASGGVGGKHTYTTPGTYTVGLSLKTWSGVVVEADPIYIEVIR